MSDSAHTTHSHSHKAADDAAKAKAEAKAETAAAKTAAAAEDEPELPNPNETIPGGCYITGAKLGKGGKHYGGKVVNANGDVLAEFDDEEENTGRAAVKIDEETGAGIPVSDKPKHKPKG